MSDNISRLINTVRTLDSGNINIINDVKQDTSASLDGVDISTAVSQEDKEQSLSIHTLLDNIRNSQELGDKADFYASLGENFFKSIEGEVTNAQVKSFIESVLINVRIDVAPETAKLSLDQFATIIATLPEDLGPENFPSALAYLDPQIIKEFILENTEDPQDIQGTEQIASTTMEATAVEQSQIPRQTQLVAINDAGAYLDSKAEEYGGNQHFRGSRPKFDNRTFAGRTYDTMYRYFMAKADANEIKHPVIAKIQHSLAQAFSPLKAGETYTQYEMKSIALSSIKNLAENFDRIQTDFLDNVEHGVKTLESLTAFTPHPALLADFSFSGSNLSTADKNAQINEAIESSISIYNLNIDPEIVQEKIQNGSLSEKNDFLKSLNLLYELNGYLQKFEQAYTASKATGEETRFFADALSDLDACFDARTRTMDAFIETLSTDINYKKDILQNAFEIINKNRFNLLDDPNAEHPSVSWAKAKEKLLSMPILGREFEAGTINVNGKSFAIKKLDESTIDALPLIFHQMEVYFAEDGLNVQTVDLDYVDKIDVAVRNLIQQAQDLNTSIKAGVIDSFDDTQALVLDKEARELERARRQSENS